MSTDPRGRRDGRPPVVSAEQLNQAISALGIATGGTPMPRARALGALLFVVEMLTMFDADRLDAAEVRSGYLNMALTAGMAINGEQMPAGTVMPAREVTADLYDEAAFAFGRMIEHRLNSAQSPSASLWRVAGERGLAKIIQLSLLSSPRLDPRRRRRKPLAPTHGQVSEVVAAENAGPGTTRPEDR
ncbi:hypothetical protein [Streptomyces noursei]|uniref:hypothetical protein n=1 Tax=Streptomyces noursei TaxID=1971 RepID=UPI0023B8268B|nr:hypothetical protein [Streptomyces noursei]